MRKNSMKKGLWLFQRVLIIAVVGAAMILAVKFVGDGMADFEQFVPEIFLNQTEKASQRRTVYDLSEKSKSVKKAVRSGESVESVGIYKTNSEQIAVVLRAENRETPVTV